MEAERSDGGGGGEAEVVDEFACAGMLRGSLTSLHTSVERIFGVTFGIGDPDLTQGNNGQIWLQLQGRSSSVKAAKLFVKGLVNQEQQQELSYPDVLHCVFCGAKGLFLDCLIRSTSALIVVGSPGFLLISGLMEPVVRAYSLITDLVERCDGSQTKRSDIRHRSSGESLDSRRAFKTLVEQREDRHILDLLVLPGTVKEILLDLVKESGLGLNQSQAASLGGSEGEWDNGVERWVEGMTAGAGTESKDPFIESLSISGGARGRAEGSEERLTRSPQEVGEELEQAAELGAEVNGEEDEKLQFLLLLKFFTAMGYTEDVVKRVLAQTGPKEASQILDFVQQEQDRSDSERTVQYEQDVRNRPCETEHREDEELASGGENGEKVGGKEVENGATGSTRLNEEVEGSIGEKDEGPEEDFVLGVLKKAAASCGYTEQKVAKLYNMLGEQSTHQLLLELQREDSEEMGNFRDGPREMDDVVLEKSGAKTGPAEDRGRGEVDLFIPIQNRELDPKGRVSAEPAEPDLLNWLHQPQQNLQIKHLHPKSQSLKQSPEVKGPPMPTYSSSLDRHSNFQSSKPFSQSSNRPGPATSKQNHQPPMYDKPQSFNFPKRGTHTPQPHKSTGKDSSSALVGEQRFLEGLQTPFQLRLADTPGDPTLRKIIIDGSNVAMSHGRSQFFSCRGIALAVQHFWDRGHRQISALLPQWRQKSDPRTKEQHYLGEMYKLGVVSYTPSREVQGKRISSYDDRFMLQLAQKTDGVIVTNDNLRDLLDESPVFRDIIKKRLLPFTFVGDLFMVPDDPLGRGGPHLDDFLRSGHRTPDPGNHSFAGTATAFPSTLPPRPQTEVLSFRDRTAGRNVDAGLGGNHGKGRGHGKGRSPEETAGLREQLCQVFAGQENMVLLVLQCNPAETDINVLSDLILEQQKD
ncbi:uncharacterized protein V6R79_000219 [Siganus canaliculatus]